MMINDSNKQPANKYDTQHKFHTRGDGEMFSERSLPRVGYLPGVSLHGGSFLGEWGDSILGDSFLGESGGQYTWGQFS